MYHQFRPLLLASAVMSLATFAACQKATVEPNNQPAPTIVGRWALVQTSGGIGGGTHPADPQRYQEVEFMADGQARALVNGMPTVTGAYTLSPAVAYVTRRTETFLQFPAPQMGSKQFITELSATTLVLSEDFIDGQSVKYQREIPFFCGTR